ncbi:LysR family transcriptional regulator [Pseudomaricurvus alcaniphilus]|uniref:LysR family transcriptional regulator n=1 Tax=Pseudomaricurvus alcaniphilus TaxID=1166482 RepID=UPI001409F9C2|nr:LysR family transcriptional regulator [Pseudomaricurvus alcaniphilus]NHN36516.1 LysR family transcriptional regulator [Pseudomaricurvus alcaniphilus]
MTTMVNTPKNLRAIDLNLLPVLRSLLKTKNVTRTAELLHMSQSAVSEALKRIRLQFNDDVLVRVGRNMVLTHFAHTIEEKLDSALKEIETLTQAEEIDLLSLHREIIIATADCVIVALGKKLIEELRIKAPNVHVQIINVPETHVLELERGEIDFIIVPEPIVEGNTLYKEPLYKEEFICIARRGNQKVSSPLSKDEFSKLANIGYRPEANSAIRVNRPFKDGWVEQLLVPHFTLLPFLVEQSDSIALVQRHVGEIYSRHFEIDIIECDMGIAPMQVSVFWSEAHQNDAFHRWLRGKFKDFLADDINFIP